MFDDDSDRLVSAAQDGDARALEQLLATHRETVFRYGLRFCRSTEDAEDAVQETLWAASRSLSTFRRGAAITTWLFTIVRNNCHRLWWKHRHEETDLADAFPQWTERTAEDEVTSAEVRRILARALARLEPAHREILLLRDVEGLTAPEAAERLSITIDAVKSRLHRAREALRGEIATRDLTRC
ncbi:RNA polymerase sigma factor [Sandaracinus amylolyticus]|uniref:RNA polymerase sigma factor n=1 Tax=Sandaracinus amylolyticus TaxID=927083 RepID=UPI001F46CE86|nr:RNA polymerase sigma factor [Sandaracinus amylolyticus]UJR82945.1 Hypothetical protein I5071_50100 [Sandaracinus amylolyticus]